MSTAFETIREAELIQNNLQEACKSISTTVVPIYSFTIFRDTPFIQFILSHNVSHIDAMVDLLEQNATNAMDQLLEHIFGGYNEIVTEARNDILNSIGYI